MRASVRACVRVCVCVYYEVSQWVFSLKKLFYVVACCHYSCLGLLKYFDR